MSDYNFEITEVSPVERDVKVTVPESEINERLDSVFAELTQTAQVKGFRQGKVPKKVIQKMYRSRVLKDVQADLIQDGYRQLIEKESVHPLSMPQIDKQDYTGSGDYSYTFKIEVKPPIEKVSYEDLTIEREKAEVKDEAVDTELESRREKASVMKPVEGRDVSEASDWVKVNYEGFKGDEPFSGGKAEGEEINLGGSQFIPGFEQNLVGKKVNEPFEFSITFPDDFRVETLKGQEIIFKCELLQILERVTPELDDEFAKDMGDYDDLNQYRIAVREELEAQRKDAVAREFRNNVWKKVVEANPLPMPPTLLKDQIRATAEQQAMQWAQYGLDPATMGMKPEDLEEGAKKQAEFNLTGIFLEETLALELEVKVSDEEVEQHLVEMAEQMQYPLDQVKDYYAQEDRMDSIRFNVRHDKIVDILAEKVNVEEVEPKPATPPGAGVPLENTEEAEETEEKE